MEKKMKFDVNYLLMEKLLARIPISKEKAEESSEIEKKVDLITKNCLEALKN